MNRKTRRHLVGLLRDAVEVAEAESLDECAKGLRAALASVPRADGLPDPRHLARKLDTFTVTELAKAMNGSRATADRAVRRMIAQGIVRDTGLRRKHNGSGRPAPVFEYVKAEAKILSRPKREPVELEAIRGLPPTRRHPVRGTGKQRKITDPGIRALVDAAKRDGCEVKSTGGGHLAVRAPDGTVVTLPFTPSDNRAVLNCRAKLRQAGVSV